MTNSLRIFIYQCRTIYAEVSRKIIALKAVGKRTEKEEHLLDELDSILFYLADCDMRTADEVEQIKQLAIRKSGYRIIDISHPDMSNVTQIEDPCCFMNVQDYFLRTILPNTELNPAKEITAFIPIRDTVAQKNKFRIIFSDGSFMEALAPDHNEHFRIQGGDVDPLYGEAYHFTEQEREDLLALIYRQAQITLTVTNGNVAKKGTSFIPQLSGQVIPNKDDIGQKRLDGSAANLPNQNNSFTKTMPAITDTTTYTYEADRTNKNDVIMAKATVNFYFPMYFGVVDPDFLSLNDATIEAAVKAFPDERIVGKSNIIDINFNGQNKKMCFAIPDDYGLPVSIRSEAGVNILPSFLVSPARVVNFSFTGFAPKAYRILVNDFALNLDNRKQDLLFFPL